MQPLTPKRILVFFVPLALSWVLMSVEAPISNGILTRLPDAKVQTAGFLMVMAISLFVESPVMDLLSTGATLGKDAASIKVIERFALLVMLTVTLAHCLIAFTPLYGLVVRGILSAPESVAEAARVPLMIMAPWSAAIGWRRFRQSIMIRQGQTRAITLGTGLRLMTILAVGFGMASTRQFEGLEVVAVALSASVIAEAAFIHYLSKRAIEAQCRTEPTGQVPSLRQVFAFHAPLTLGTIVVLTGPPLLSKGLSSLPDPVTTMAAWQIAAGIAFCFRTATFALPEVVITLAKDAQSARAMRTFCLQLGCFFAGLMALTWSTGLLDWLIGDALGYRASEPGLIEPAKMAFSLATGLPIMTAIAGYLRGRLTSHMITRPRVFATAANVGTLALAMGVAVQMRWSGVIVAPLALTAAVAAENVVQGWFWLRNRGRVQLKERHQS